MHSCPWVPVIHSGCTWRRCAIFSRTSKPIASPWAWQTCVSRRGACPTAAQSSSTCLETAVAHPQVAVKGTHAAPTGHPVRASLASQDRCPIRRPPKASIWFQNLFGPTRRSTWLDHRACMASQPHVIHMPCWTKATPWGVRAMAFSPAEAAVLGPIGTRSRLPSCDAHRVVYYNECNKTRALASHSK